MLGTILVTIITTMHMTAVYDLFLLEEIYLTY